jgi:single-strand DNA-binding protein
MNNCVLTGNLGADPEVRYTSNGDPIAHFNLAFKSTRNKEDPNWIKVTCFNKLAEVCQTYLHKGARIGLSGILQQEKWTTEDGENRSNHSVIANQIEFIKTDGRGFENGQQAEEIPY